MKTKHHFIKGLTESFLSENIDFESPAGLCFAISYPLQIYLLTKNIYSRLRVGKVPAPKLDDPDFKNDHFWLQIDGDGTILDPTIRQFDLKITDSVYVGKLCDNKVSNTYIVCHLSSRRWFQEVYSSWRNPFVDQSYPFNSLMKLNIVFQINLASKLHLEITDLHMHDKRIARLYVDYFGPIFVFLQNWKKGLTPIDLNPKELHSNFNRMLSEALSNQNS